MSNVDFQENVEYMTPEEIKNWLPYTEYPPLEDFSAPLKKRISEVAQNVAGQAAGKRWSIGCVSLEITQRCNLDCTLCYLSDVSEAVKDTPLQEIFRRIDMIYRHYGPWTDVQVSGGDPTLRDRKELVQIIKRISAYKMQPSLFTNGIKASRELLQELAAAGLVDVAFHVDLTQERKGYTTEESLNEIRLKYIERAEGLGLNIFFNTTVYAGNFKEIPNLVEFFKQQAHRIELASFQLQADTGRGVLRERDFLITQKSVIEQIEKGAGLKINFDVPLIGHPKCNKKTTLFEVNGNLYNFNDSKGFIAKMVDIAPVIDRSNQKKTIQKMFKSVLLRPNLWLEAMKFIFNFIWLAKRDLIAARGKVNKLTFFIHNFMDACKLEKDRIHSCVFMVATHAGPISMCMHNAKRDDYILKSFKVKTDEGEGVFSPLNGFNLSKYNEEQLNPLNLLNSKKLKGRLKQQKQVEAL